MRRGVLSALVAAAACGALVACNALSGVSDLASCTDNCGSLGMPDREDGGGADGRVDIPPNPGGDSGTMLPPTCTGNEVTCAGKVAAQCVGGTWQTQTCAQVCIAGKCDSWPSCRNPAGTGCGATGGGNPGTSCCETANVPGGTFNRQTNGAPATLSAFDLDKYEVTVGRMRAFVDAGGVTQAAPPASGAGAHPKIPNSGWQSAWNVFLPADVAALRAMFQQSNPTWTTAAGGNEHLPINNVSWFVAFSFCAWDGGRLPTYAESTYAAAGGNAQRPYPWSSSPNDVSITRTRAAYNCNYTLPARNCPASYCSTSPGVTPCNAATCIAPAMCVSPSCTGCGFNDIAPVGALPSGAGRWGHFDLAGNMAELTLDVDTGLPEPCTDCAQLPPTNVKGGPGNPKLGANFINTGGAWDNSSDALVSGTFSSVFDGELDEGVGFRCAR